MREGAKPDLVGRDRRSFQSHSIATASGQLDTTAPLPDRTRSILSLEPRAVTGDAAGRLVRFLRTELAPMPGRDRDTLGIVAASVVATAIVMAGHLPHGMWAIVAILIVSPADAGASIEKALERFAGTLIGGAVGLIAIIAFVDAPWFLLPVIGLVVAVGMFLSRTTSAPYVALIGTVTFAIVALSKLEDPAADVSVAFWRVGLTLLGLVLGTAAKMLLSTDDPEALLLDHLAGRLAFVEGLLDRLLGPPGAERPAADAVPDVAGPDGLQRELDLLKNAEVRYPSLRRRHSDQLALIVEVERLLNAVLALWQGASSIGEAPWRDEPLHTHLAAVARECARFRRDLQARRPSAPLPTEPETEVPAGASSSARAAGFIALAGGMERALQGIARAMGFLDPRQDPRLARFDAGGAPVGPPPRVPFFTPGFSLGNTEVLVVALKCALAFEIVILLLLAVDWPELLAGAATTCVIVAQSNVGASLNKELLRLAGAGLGGLLGLFTIVVLIPVLENVAAFLVVAAAGMGVAAWIYTGGSRISYAGLQTGMTFAMCVLSAFGPTTDLAPARDRVIAIILGIVVMITVDQLIRPVRASRAMRPALAAGLRAMADLARPKPPEADHAAEIDRAIQLRVAVYGHLAAALRLRGEAGMEPGASTPATRVEREAVFRLAAAAQAVFLALLGLARHRLIADAALPERLRGPARAFDAAVGEVLARLARKIEGEPGGALPDLAVALEPIATAGRRRDPPSRSPDDAAAVAAVAGRIEMSRGLMRELARLEADLAVVEPPAMTLRPR